MKLHVVLIYNNYRTCRFLNCVVLDEILLNGSETFERILKQKRNNSIHLKKTNK